jgi:site-specific recombinase XerD
MSNPRTTYYHLYRNRGDGRYWAILRLGNRYIYTRSSYASPLMALRKLVYQQNTNLMSNATQANINQWIASSPVERVNNVTARQILQTDQNLYNHLIASGILTFNRPRNARHRM